MATLDQPITSKENVQHRQQLRHLHVLVGVVMALDSTMVPLGRGLNSRKSPSIFGGLQIWKPAPAQCAWDDTY
jgi:hypothetical protein